MTPRTLDHLVFAATIRHPEWTEAWREQFEQELAAGWGIEIERSGQHAATLLYQGDGVGALITADREQKVRALVPPPSTPECPFAGPERGVFSWQPWTFNPDHELLVLAALRAFGDVTAIHYDDPKDRLTVRSTLRASELRSFPLEDVLSKYGFADGDALLSRSSSGYLDYVCTTVGNALEVVGLARDNLCLMGTVHNPLRLALVLGTTDSAGKERFEPLSVSLQGARLSEEETKARLEKTQVTFWAFPSESRAREWIEGQLIPNSWF